MGKGEISERVSKLKQLYRYIVKFGKMISDNHTAACAAQSAFFVLLSIVPLVSLLLAVATYLPFSQEDVLGVLMEVVPHDLYVYVKDILADLYARAGTTVISVSAVAMLWSVSNGIKALMDGFNSMYGLGQENGFVKSRIMALAYAAISIIVFAVVLSVYLMVSHYYKVSVRDVFAVDELGTKLLLSIRYLLGWLLFYFFILMLYVILPGGFGLPMGKEEHSNLGMRIKSQMPGAAFASVAWMCITRVMGLYIKVFPNISFMYGSFAGIVLAMLWLYFCMYSLFIGAVSNHLLSKGYLTRVKKMLQ